MPSSEREPLLRRTADLGARALERSARLSRREAARRARVLRNKAYFIVQCALAAATSYALAKYLFRVPIPLFAPVAAMVCLGMTHGQRLRRALEITVGVAVGVFFGELLVHFFGIGVWQIALLVMLAMSTAALLGAGALIVTQAGVQGLVVALLGGMPGTAFGRWFEALIGCAVAILFASVVPSSTLLRPRAQASEIMDHLADLLSRIAQAVRDRDRPAAESVLTEARTTEEDLDKLRGYATDSVDMLRVSPFHRRRISEMQRVRDSLEPLDRAVRNARVLIRRGTVSLQTGEEVPGSYVRAIEHLATVVAELAEWYGRGSPADDTEDVPALARADLLEIGRETAHPEPGADLSAEVIRAQIRSMLVDLLQMIGQPFREAQAAIAETAGEE